MDKKDRLFVPLSTWPFEDFRDRGKQYEVRKYGRGFTEKHVYAGRAVELRKGYSGESLWGTVGEVIVAALEDIFDSLDFRLAEPQAGSKEDAIASDRKMMGDDPEYIAFQVILDRDEH